MSTLNPSKMLSGAQKLYYFRKNALKKVCCPYVFLRFPHFGSKTELLKYFGDLGSNINFYARKICCSASPGKTMQNHLELSSKIQFWTRSVRNRTKSRDLVMSGPVQEDPYGPHKGPGIQKYRNCFHNIDF